MTSKIGVNAVLSFAHALALLREEKAQGVKNWLIDSNENYEFVNNEIIRIKSIKKDKGTPESGKD